MKNQQKVKIRKRVEEKLRPLTLPNFITMLRMAIVPFFVIAVLDRNFILAVWILVVAALSDALDGWIARRFHARSLIGAILDPVADKVLLTTAYISLTIPFGQDIVIPLWLAIIALFRDFLILLVALILYMGEGITSFPPSILGKATTFMHVITVTAVLIANLGFLPTWFMTLVFVISFSLVISSGFNYIYRASHFIEEAREMSGDGGLDEEEEGQEEG